MERNEHTTAHQKIFGNECVAIGRMPLYSAECRRTAFRIGVKLRTGSTVNDTIHEKKNTHYVVDSPEYM